jgi:predicted transcriptional regulator
MKTNQGNRFVLPVNVTLTKKDLDAYANEPLKRAVKVYKKQIASRERYIKKLHDSIKNKKNLIMISYVMDEVMSPMPRLLNKKRLMILAELYDKDYLTESKMRELMVSIQMNPKKTGSDFNYLIDNELIKRHNKFSYYITDKGKQFVEYFSKNTSIMFFNMLAKRDSFKITKAKKKVVISEELSALRSRNYKMMMQPFWDNSITRMPKDRINRCKILWEWMQANKMEQNEFYLRMLHKWSSK